MPRRKLIDYLNNPMLLKDISTEEMKAWAEDAPYAGLVQKLLAQKLIIEKAGQKELDAAKAMSILSNANPKYALSSLEDFKKMILEDESEETEQELNDDKQVIIPPVIPAHSVSDHVEATADSELAIASEEVEEIEEEFKEEPIEEVKEEELDERIGLEEDMVEEIDEVEEIVEIESEVEEVTDVSEDEEDTSEVSTGSFTSWLSTLSAIHIEEKVYDVNIELDDEAPVSDTLAKLLVQQGHHTEAIEMYEKLILKYPQKSSFFAAQITKLKEL